MSVPQSEDPPLVRARPVRDHRDVGAWVVALGIIALVVVGLVKPWSLGGPSSAMSSAPTAAPQMSSSAQPSLVAAAPPSEAPDTDHPVSDDVWRLVGPALAHDAVVAAVRGGIVAIDPVSGRSRQFLRCETGCTPRGTLAVSPTGTSIAYADTVNGVASIRTVDIASGRSKVVTRCEPCVADGLGLGWSPDGRTLAFSAGATGIWTVTVDDSSLRHVSTWGDSLTFSPDGTGLMLDDGRVYDLDSSRWSRLGIHGAFGAAWSPDGSRLAYVTDPAGSVTQPVHADPFVEQLWVADIDGSHRVKVAERAGCCLGAWVAGPAWSPDGKHLVWPAGVDHTLVVVAADGSSARDLASGELLPVRPAWLGVPSGR